MTLPLKPESVALLYDYAKSLPPFSSIRGMPASEEVEFWIVTDRERVAWWQWINDTHRISISMTSVSQSMTLLMYLGHEMCHVAEDVLGKNPGGSINNHGATFKKLATRFCKVHGFDLRAFY